jgi:hypothetical protein
MLGGLHRPSAVKCAVGVQTAFCDDTAGVRLPRQNHGGLLNAVILGIIGFWGQNALYFRQFFKPFRRVPNSAK